MKIQVINQTNPINEAYNTKAVVVETKARFYTIELSYIKKGFKLPTLHIYSVARL